MKRFALIAFALTSLLGMVTLTFGIMLVNPSDAASAYAMSSGDAQAVADTALSPADIGEMNSTIDLWLPEADMPADGGDLSMIALHPALVAPPVAQPGPQSPAPLTAMWRGRTDCDDFRGDGDCDADDVHGRHVARLHHARFFIHVVRFGETLSGIARRFGTTVRRLAFLNDVDNVNLIFVGQRLLVPR